MNKKKTIGNWLPKLGGELKVKPFWTLVRDERGTHAVVDACVLVKQDAAVIGIARLGVVDRGADYPDDESWQPGSIPVMEAVRMVADVAARDYSWLDVRMFAGVNCALPWEIPQPKPHARWHRLWHCLCFWRKRG